MEIHYVVSTSVIKSTQSQYLNGYISQKWNSFRNVPSACVKVKSRGQLVSAGTTYDAKLTLLPEFSWAPCSNIIVYCVHPSGEIVSDAAKLHVVQTPRNMVRNLSVMSQQKLHSCWTADVNSSARQVSLSWSQWEVEPGDDVTLRVEVMEPASLVGVLVVDKTTKWAGHHNDITMDVVRAHLNQPVGSLGSRGIDLVSLWY